MGGTNFAYSMTVPVPLKTKAHLEDQSSRIKSPVKEMQQPFLPSPANAFGTLSVLL